MSHHTTDSSFRLFKTIHEHSVLTQKNKRVADILITVYLTAANWFASKLPSRMPTVSNEGTIYFFPPHASYDMNHIILIICHILKRLSLHGKIRKRSTHGDALFIDSCCILNVSLKYLPAKIILNRFFYAIKMP